jgi:DNA-binding Xre family transcriptional regulator
MEMNGKIKELIKLKKVTYTELAMMFGLTENTIRSRVKNDNWKPAERSFLINTKLSKKS